MDCSKVLNSDCLVTLANIEAQWDEHEFDNFAECVKTMEFEISKRVGKVKAIEGTKYPFGIKFQWKREKYYLFLGVNKNGYTDLHLRML